MTPRLPEVRYEAGQFFAPHFDGRGSGSSTRGKSAEFTVVLYLSDDFAGGETCVFPRLPEIAVRDDRAMTRDTNELVLSHTSF